MTDQHPVFDPPPPAGEVKPLLIEDWLPITELGIESVRERQAASALPPLSFLHIWWARRPLAGCQGVQLAALLPPWSPELGETPGLLDGLERVRAFRRHIPSEKRTSMTDEDWFKEWVSWMAGVWGDTRGEYEAMVRNKNQGKVASSPFTHAQAYRNKPTAEDLTVLWSLFEQQWGRRPVVVDPTAGGGSIPLTAMRYGLPTVSNDLNPVAVSVLESTLVAPYEHGASLTPDLLKWGGQLCERLQSRLEPAFPLEDPEEHVTGYLWVNVVDCPRTGGSVPLAPNWWLDTKGKNSGRPDEKVAVRPVPVFTDNGMPDHIDYQLAYESELGDFDPSEGSITRGTAVSPWDDGVVDGDWIKSEAQAGRMDAQLYAVAAWRDGPGRGKDRYFRAPTATDIEGIRAAEQLLASHLDRWEANDVLPTEAVPNDINDQRPHNYGMPQWRDMFTPRMLLVHGMFVEEWRALLPQLEAELGRDRGRDIAGLLALMAGKALNFSSKLASMQTSRPSVRGVFDRHDFAFKWTFAEFDGARELWPWCLEQLSYSYDGKVNYEGLGRLVEPRDDELTRSDALGKPLIIRGSATELTEIMDGTVECVNIDPPYYDNVMYAELADYFYVWEKRTLSALFPERYSDSLSDKDAEAVANPARFNHLSGKEKKRTANLDYQNKMRDIFAESRRVLRDDGVMVVWFTHKAADAWDTLGAAIMDAGFAIETSWPINTESTNSLHLAKRNAAKSTIVLVCRKRPERGNEHVVFFKDIAAEVRVAARNAAVEFEKVVGHHGVDLMLSTYGPALGVLSSHWPVMSSEADTAGNAIPLRPDEALDVARSEVARLRIGRLVGTEKQFDPPTDFVLIAWDTFRAQEFPYDEGRKLAYGVGADVDELIGDKVLRKSGGNVSLVAPADRVARRIDPEGPFDSVYDAICVLLRIYELDGAAAARGWLVERGFDTPGSFRQAVSAYGAAVPRVRGKKGWTLDEARLLDEVAVNVPTLELRLADADEQLVEPEQLVADV